MEKGNVVLLAGEGRSTNIVYNALAAEFHVEAVLIEDPEPRFRFLRRRIKSLGWGKVLGQVAFLAGIAPFLEWRSQERVDQILDNHGLEDTPPSPRVVQRISSVNSQKARERLRASEPAIVVINGTRIIDDETLRCVDAPFLNLHAGITPRYRGVHGAYWALVEGQEDLCGATVHLVDEGIDTGAIISQVTIQPEEQDNYATYPFLQLAAGIPQLVEAVRKGLAEELEPSHPSGESNLWSHPTITQYVWNRFHLGVS